MSRSARLAVLLVLPLACAPAERRGWECIAPANPGGGWDLTCRAAAAVMEDLGLAPGPVRTTNLPGAGGGVAMARAVAQRAGDPGLLVAASPGTTLRLAQGQFGPLEVDDVRWVGALGVDYGVLAVAPDAPWRTLADLLATLRTDPTSVIFSGGSAVAGQDHMKVLILAHRQGVDPRRIRYVPFDGGGEAMTALLGGFVQVFAGDGAEAEAQVAAGRMRVLAVLAPQRLGGALAGVPTAAEQGVAVEWATWRGFYAPGGIDDEAYGRWVDVLERVGASEAWQEARRRSRLQPFLVVGEAFEEMVVREVADFEALSREIGLLR